MIFCFAKSGLFKKFHFRRRVYVIIRFKGVVLCHIWKEEAAQVANLQPMTEKLLIIKLIGCTGTQKISGSLQMARALAVQSLVKSIKCCQLLGFHCYFTLRCKMREQTVNNKSSFWWDASSAASCFCKV